MSIAICDKSRKVTVWSRRDFPYHYVPGIFFHEKLNPTLQLCYLFCEVLLILFSLYYFISSPLSCIYLAGVENSSIPFKTPRASTEQYLMSESFEKTSHVSNKTLKFLIIFAASGNKYRLYYWMFLAGVFSRSLVVDACRMIKPAQRRISGSRRVMGFVGALYRAWTMQG